MVKIFKAEAARRQYDENNDNLKFLYKSLVEAISDMIVKESRNADHISFSLSTLFGLPDEEYWELGKKVIQSFKKVGYKVLIDRNSDTVTFSW